MCRFCIITTSPHVHFIVYYIKVVLDKESPNLIPVIYSPNSVWCGVVSHLFILRECIWLLHLVLLLDIIIAGERGEIKTKATKEIAGAGHKNLPSRSAIQCLWSTIDPSYTLMFSKSFNSFSPKI